MSGTLFCSSIESTELPGYLGEWEVCSGVFGPRADGRDHERRCFFPGFSMYAPGPLPGGYLPITPSLLHVCALFRVRRLYRPCVLTPPPAAAVVSRRAPSAPVWSPKLGDRLWWPQFASAAVAPGGVPVERVSVYTPVVADRPLEQFPSDAVTRTSGARRRAHASPWDARRADDLGGSSRLPHGAHPPARLAWSRRAQIRRTRIGPLDARAAQRRCCWLPRQVLGRRGPARRALRW